MKIDITAKGLEITQSLRNLMDEKFKRIYRHFSHHIIKTHVVLKIGKLINTAEVNIIIDKAEINAISEDIDLYKAIDKMVNRLDKQLIKFKDKLNNKQ